MFKFEKGANENVGSLKKKNKPDIFELGKI